MSKSKDRPIPILSSVSDTKERNFKMTIDFIQLKLYIAGVSTFHWKSKKWPKTNRQQKPPGLAKRLMVLTLCGKQTILA
jgi:hypothetical protein